MECLFLGVNKINCTLHQRCEGIYQVMLNLSAEKKVANSFSKYVWRRSFVNKLKDTIHDSTSGINGSINKTLAKLAVAFSKPLIKDVYNLETNLSNIESQLHIWEKKNEPHKPMTYFRKSGEGYSLIFKKAAILSKCSSTIVKEMELLGQNLGTLITLRDSIQDRKMDSKFGNYNPFLDWSKEDMINYYHNYRKETVKDNINLIMTNEKITIKNKRLNVFHGLSLFSLASTSPFGVCKRLIESFTSDKSSIDRQLMSYIMEPDNNQPNPQDDEGCRMHCCSPTCNECFTMDGKPLGGCCNCCDCCVDCCGNTSGCASGCSGFSC